jgi:hypothetical protein
MDASIKRIIFGHHMLISLAILVAFAFYLLRGPHDDYHITWTLCVTAGVIAFIFFGQKQQIEEMRLFAQMFREFNARYEKLNDELNAIYQGDSEEPLTHSEHECLNAYFNLCGEEYLCFKLGYIDPGVWKSWQNGITHYLKNDRICTKWLQEAETGSYYGLETQCECRMTVCNTDVPLSVGEGRGEGFGS